MVKPPTTQNHHGWKNPHMICAHGTQLPPNLLFRARSGSGPAQPRQGYDVSMDALQDIGLVLGFLNALHLMLRIRAKGLAWLAIPCNSFNFMSSSQHQRSFWQPYGNQHMPWVVMGNEVCTRSSMLILVGIVRRVVFFVENPIQSTINCWPFFNHIIHKPWLSSFRTSWNQVWD